MFTKLVGLRLSGTAASQTFPDGTVVVDETGNLVRHDGHSVGGQALTSTFSGNDTLTELQTINSTLSGSNTATLAELQTINTTIAGSNTSLGTINTTLTGSNSSTLTSLGNINTTLTGSNTSTLASLQNIGNALTGATFITPRQSAFGEQRVVSRTPVVELASMFPISAYRDVVSTSGSATVVKSTSGSEYALATTAAGSDAASIVTAERGRYKPGYSANVGVGVRIPTLPTGNQTAMWGAFDASNGMYFGVDATSIYVAVLNGGVETRFRQSSWNVDRLDGTGITGLTLDLTRGNIFQMTFSWYGYGVIEFEVMIPDGSTGQQRNVCVHRFSPAHQTSIANPNLPVGAQVKNNGTSAAMSLYVGGRQYSIVGVYNPNERTTSAVTLSRATTTTRTPLMTFQRSSASTSLYIPARLNGLDCIASADSVLEVILNGTLTGASYGSIANIASPETALQVDTSASAVSGGSLIYAALISTSGSGKSQTGSTALGGLSLDVPNTQPLTVCIRTISGTGTASLVGRMIEDW